MFILSFTFAKCEWVLKDQNKSCVIIDRGPPVKKDDLHRTYSGFIRKSVREKLDKFT